jgi:hypothetical protein
MREDSSLTISAPAEPRPATRCPNCGSPATDRYCPGCGQRTGERLVSLGAFVRDVLEDLFSVEARLPRTLAALLGRPGSLTAEYAAGRVARYVPPFRLYLVSGLAFFMVVSYVASFDRLWSNTTPFVDEVTGDVREGATIVLIHLPIDTTSISRPLVPLVRDYVRQQDRLNALPPREAARILYGGTFSRVSGTVLLLIPAFALLLKALYRRRLYIEHTVFVLHLHAAIFLMALPPLLVQRAWMTAPFAAWGLAYLFLALRRVYRESAGRTAVKFLLLLLTYAVGIAAVLLGVTVVTVLRF